LNSAVSVSGGGCCAVPAVFALLRASPMAVALRGRGRAVKTPPFVITGPAR
jgi:hypothetical protein